MDRYVAECELECEYEFDCGCDCDDDVKDKFDCGCDCDDDVKDNPLVDGIESRLSSIELTLDIVRNCRMELLLNYSDLRHYTMVVAGGGVVVVEAMNSHLILYHDTFH